MQLVPSFLSLVQSLAPAFTAPSFRTLQTVLTGWLLARRRTVTAMMVAAGAVDEKHHASFQSFFHAANAVFLRFQGSPLRAHCTPGAASCGLTRHERWPVAAPGPGPRIFETPPNDAPGSYS